MENNSKSSAFPVIETEFTESVSLGLTKHEYSCIKLGIAESGCKEIDDLILKSERKKIAGVCLQGILSNRELQLALYADCSTRYFIENGVTPHNALTFEALRLADELLKQLSETK